LEFGASPFGASPFGASPFWYLLKKHPTSGHLTKNQYKSYQSKGMDAFFSFL